MTSTRTSRSRALRRVALACLLSAGAAFGVHAADNPRAAKFYEDALVRYEKKDYAGAIIQLKNALKADNRLLPVHVLLGKALLENGEVNAAEVALREALRLGVNRAEVVVALAGAVTGQARPQDLLAQAEFADAGLPAGVRLQLLVLKASAASDLGKHVDALRFIDEARALDPGRAETWVAEVPLRLRAQQVKEGQAAAEKALALAPNAAEALYQRGIVAHLQGDLKGALAFYDKAIAARPTHADSLISRAGILIDLGRADDAAKDIAAVRQSSPIDPRGAYLAALLAERAGRTSEAKSALNDVTGLLDPVPPEYMRYRPQLLMLGGLAHYGLNQYEKARPYLEMVQRQMPASGASKLLANVYLREKNHNRAIESLELYLRAHPNDTQAIHLLASVHMSQGRPARAAALTQEALKKTDDPTLRGMLGMSLVGSGKFASGAAELEAAYKRDPKQTQAAVALVSLYLQSGQAARALPLAESLVRAEPGNAGFHNLLGSARGASNNLDGARAAYEQAGKLAPAFLAPQVNLARMDIAARNFGAAQSRLATVLSKDEKNIDAMVELARLAAARSQPAETQRWLEKAAAHAGNNLQPGLQLVEFHLARGRADLAADALRGVEGKAPDALQVLLMQARVHLATRQLPKARTTLTRATALATYDAAMLVQIAALLLQADGVPGAAHALEKALAERPSHLNARALMAEVELRQGELAKAETRARGLVASHPKLGIGHGLLGDVARARGQQQAALDAYRRAHELDRSPVSALRLFTALEPRDPAAAARLAAEWLRANPNDLAVRRAAADAHARGGRLAEARAGYEAIVKLAPDDAAAWNNLANVQVMQRDAAAGLASAERALKLMPEAPHVIGTTGWAAFHAGQPDRALQLLRDARLRDPANPDTRYFLGAVLAQRGRAGEAREELQAALDPARRTGFASDAESLLRTLK